MKQGIIIVLLCCLPALVLRYVLGQQAVRTEEVWVTWTNLPPKWNIEYARSIGLGSTQWIVYLQKVDATMPMTNFQLQVVAPNEQRFWRMVPK